MQERGESSARPQQGWGAEYGETQQLSQPYYGQPAPGPQQFATPTVKSRPRWKTPLIAVVALGVGIAIGAAAGGSKSNSPSTTAGTASTSSNAPGAPSSAAKAAPPAAAPAAPAKSVVLQTSGDGQKTTKTFTVAGDWSAKYTYDCTGFGAQGNFSISENGGAIDGLPIVNTLGTKGGDTSYQHNDAGQRSLEVDSECSWTLTVTSGDAG